MLVLGIDPGVSGAYALYETAGQTVFAADMPVVDGQVDGATFATEIVKWGPQAVVIERVASMPKQGVASTFKFGVAYGIVRGIVATLQIPAIFVTPGKWKRHFGLAADKEESRSRALQLWPARSDLFKRKKDHGRAEAALLARFYAETTLTPPRKNSI